MRRVLLLAIVSAWLWGGSPAHAEPYIVAVNHAPPYRMIMQTENGPVYSGFYVDVIKAVADRVGIEIIFEEVPFKRALRMMRSGAADLMIGPNRTSEREAYMVYVEERLPSEDKAFFRHPADADIQVYDDLRSLNIGVLRGSVYFSPFDTDETLKKEVFDDYVSGFKMLDRGRVDTVIVPELLGDHIVCEHSLNLIKSGLFAEGRPSYFTVSRQSTLIPAIDDLAAALRALKADGQVDAIRARY